MAKELEEPVEFILLNGQKMADNKRPFYPDRLKPAEGYYYKRTNGTCGLVFACPVCGHPGTNSNIFDPRFKSLKSKITCGQFSCGWSGHLEKGYFNNERKPEPKK